MPTVTIDGKKVQVPQETTILSAARRAGVWIPTLCHHPALPPLAACRICLVELAGPDGRPGRLVTACSYLVQGDLEVSVSGARAAAARRGVIELLLARSPESPELRELAGRMGVGGTPHPRVTEGVQNCILCGLCVEVCEQMVGVSAIGFAGRGADETVAVPFGEPSTTCIACGACAAVCPVGAIRLRVHAAEGEAELSPFDTRVPLLVCAQCGKRPVGTHPLAEPLARKTLERLDGRTTSPPIDWGELRKLARLCPECRRKRAAAALAVPAGFAAGGKPAGDAANQDGKRQDRA